MIDTNIQIELRNKYNPDGSVLRQHQLRMLEMLKYFDELCVKNNIRYWLSSGTCLGAVRHGGFIPWDDDVDVEMLREDYLKLEKVFKETDTYVLQTWKSDSGYCAPYAKMRDKRSYLKEYGQDSLYEYRGIYIDVFQLEYSSKFVAKVYEYLLWRYIIPLSRSTNKSRKNLYYILKKIYFRTIPFIRFFSSWFPGNQLRHTYGSGWVNKTRKLESLFPTQRIVFEDLMLPIPQNVDTYLKDIYGDYMRLPSYDKIREPHIKEIKLEL